MLRRTVISSLFAAALVAAFAPRPAAAHPHVWIDLRSQLEFDGAGRVTGLGIDWTFDEFYTAFIASEVGGVDDPDPAKLEDIGRQSLVNLRDFDYFTEVLVDGTPQAFAVPETFDIGLREGKLWMRFTVPLERAVDPADRRVSYAVFDPTYYISILHEEDRAAYKPESVPEGCAMTLEEPTPTTEAISLAQSLDLLDSAPQTLGAMFAERVRLACN